MNVLIINEVCGYTSTGKIVAKIAEDLEAEGNTVRIAYGRSSYVPDEYKRFGIRIGNDLDVKMHAILTRLTDRHGLYSKRATRKFLKWAEEYKPDLLWLHNLHGYYINYEMLFAWIKKHPGLEVKWTLHDCWAFTGHCTHYSFIKCDRWKTRCYGCPQKKEYPSCYFLDNSKSNYLRKKAAFTGVKDLTIITPSKWLSEQVKSSFLKEYKTEVKYNEISKEIFKPIPSGFRKQYGIENKIVILGVANIWSERKGLNDFIELAEMLDDKYVMVLVGLKEKQIKEISKRLDWFVPEKECNIKDDVPADHKVRVHSDASCDDQYKWQGGKVIPQGVNNIYRTITGSDYKRDSEKDKHVYRLICIQHTKDAVELAKIYSASDVFVNATYEDNYPTVNLEALACGSRVITYETGGAPETVEQAE